jgi:hypothetical protein
MVKENIKPILGPALGLLNTHTISDELYCISNIIKVLATTIDRYGNLIRNGENQFWGEHLTERQDAFPEDDERPLGPGWRINGLDYPESEGLTRRALANEVVPRPSGYIPFQSIFEPDGRHAYNPAGRQYPQMVTAGMYSRQRAETPLDRHQAYEQVRPDPSRFAPNVPYELQVSDAPVYRSQPQRRLSPNRQLMPPPPRPRAAETPDQPIYRSMTAPYSTAPGGYQGQPHHGGMGAQPGPWDEFRSARR